MTEAPRVKRAHFRAKGVAEAPIPPAAPWEKMSSEAEYHRRIISAQAVGGKRKAEGSWQ
jgi:hypothetical protein